MKMPERLTFTPRGWSDYSYWLAEDRAMVKRINRLLAETMRSPFEGIGKPEPLSQNLSGTWSRRIDQRHRLVYAVEGDQLVVLQARHHYD
jgi:toxin YoeB